MKMKLDKKMARLICELEYCIGRECFNAKSYDGWTGVEGAEFRYPVTIRARKNDEGVIKTNANLAREYPRIGCDAIGTMKYVFGSNQLFIGNGIMNLLEKLEERYNLDFNELEEQRRAKKAKQ